MSKIYIRKVYENNKYTISFGTEEDVKDWKEQEKEWIEQDFSVADDSIKLLCILIGTMLISDTDLSQYSHCVVCLLYKKGCDL